MPDKGLRDAREEQQELEALHRLDEECVHQQRAGNYLKAFDCMERALVLRRHFFGIESEEVIQACRALAEMCNLLGMSFLQQDNYPVTIDLLKKAEVLTQRHHPVERATTLNNFACYYRRLGKLHSAMTSLKHALDLEKKLKNVRNAADTQLNMCAVLSQLGKHQDALEHAQDALITLQEGFIHDKRNVSTDNSTGDSTRLDRISVMCIAYHNIGVEQEFLKEYSESVASYKKGIGLAEQYLGADHSITTTIRNSYLAAKRTLATKVKVKPGPGNHDQKSPKAGARLVSSPRGGSLRMPSPLSNEKDHRNGFPTPRSIITEALSRSPLSALPSLEVQSPSCASKKKKNTVPDEVKSAAPSLSPTDPFFSPRFRFDSDMTRPKPKVLASIANPRSAALADGEVRSSSNSSKRERRKSSVKKPPLTSETRRNGRKISTDERVKNATTPRETEENSTANAPSLLSPTHDSSDEKAGGYIDGSSNESMKQERNGEMQNLPVAGGIEGTEVSTALTMSNKSYLPDAVTCEKHEIKSNEEYNGTADCISLVDQELDRNIPTPHTVCSEDTSHDIQANDLNTDGATSPVTNVIDKVTEVSLHTSLTEVSSEEENAIMGPAFKPQETIENRNSHDPASGIVTNDDSAEPSDGAVNEVEGGQDHKTPKPNTLVDTYDEVTVVSDSIEEIPKEQSRHLVVDARYYGNAEVDAGFADQGVDGTMNTGSSVDEAKANVDERNPHYSHETLDVESAQTNVPDGRSALESALAVSAENTVDLENAEIHNTNEVSSETNPETAIENHAIDEDGEAFTLSEDQSHLSATDVEEVDSAIPDGFLSANDSNPNDIEAAIPVEPSTKDQVSLLDEGQGNSLVDAQEQSFDQDSIQPESSDAVDECASAAIGHEAQVNHLYIEDHGLSEEFHPTIESYEAGAYYDENCTVVAVDTQGNAYERDEKVDHQLSEQEFVDQTEQVVDSYERQGYEAVETPYSGDTQQDWSEPFVAEHAAEYSDYYQDASVP
ncbi:hypothetical protein AM587_10004880 [Phytophthora nicotianae]|uniref:Uncharacterized protein n=1 Tax=Phytophthora nicotianae TaxID=4792 RepID=A0A0W8C6B2_PHYNI|nr:hypothetical protein AM587_10004880 [Phytophthora nicotianae]